MKRENLQRIADMLLDIPQEKFDMRFYRLEKHAVPECGSIGCVLGHATKLDAENIAKNYTHEDFLGYPEIDFIQWSEDFTGLRVDSHEWSWCFGGNWVHSDNTVEGARKRVLYLLDKGIPPEDYEMGDQAYNHYDQHYAHY